jgi:hypothetical protein
VIIVMINAVSIKLKQKYFIQTDIDQNKSLNCFSEMAQRQRVGPITQRSKDRNLLSLLLCIDVRVV